ncbi:hypothetical protein [Ectothiorhodospira mobilis]|uniref:hypothetical protein n=1 Tax=Ectothiorhodospira mobilis TaxID=195064 RepID=UPI001902E943|nr:hypothetical protein [Ectothiorhodospira mobilis]MBK1690825.1 hypothetical protein [Ectothiorhodospira mobilis]
MSGWGCPHESKGRCGKLDGRPCEPGMKGCVLAGRFVFSDPSKNTARALREKADEPLRERLTKKG